MDDDELLHFGVKGMKWGQRMARRKEIRKELRGTKKKLKQSRRRTVKAARKGAQQLVKTIKKDYDVDLTRKQVRKLVKKATKRSKKTTKKENKRVFKQAVRDVQKAELKRMQEEEKRLEAEKVEHSELAHFGIKGMKWGVRRSDEELARMANRKQQEFDNKIKRQKAKLDVKERTAKVRSDIAKAKQQEGDATRKKYEARKIKEESRAKMKADKKKAIEDRRRFDTQQKKDAVRAKIEAGKQSQKTSTKFSSSDFKHMSDDELKAVVNRMNMEAQYQKLNPKPPSKLKKTLSMVGSAAVTGKAVIDMLGGPQAVTAMMGGKQPKSRLKSSADMTIEEMQDVIKKSGIVKQYNKIRSENTPADPRAVMLDQALTIAAALGKRKAS